MNLRQQLLLSLCHARYERAVKEATKQLMREVDEVLLRIASNATTGDDDDQGHGLDSEHGGRDVDRVDISRLARDGCIRRVK